MAADGRVLPWEKLRAAALPLKDFRFRYTQNSDAISVMAGVAGQDWFPIPMTLTSKRCLTDGFLPSAQTVIRHVRRRVSDWMAM